MAMPSADELATSSSSPPASLLGLPIELRQQIYEHVYNGEFVGSKMVWSEGLVLTLYGTSNAEEPYVRAYASPFTLLRVCRQLRSEIAPSIPDIRDIRYDLQDITVDAIKSLLDMMSDSQIALMRTFHIMGWNTCTLVQPSIIDERVTPGLFKSSSSASVAPTFDKHDSDGNKICDRSLHLDLTIYERDFNKAQWDRLLNADHRAISLGTGSYVGTPVRDRDYYKGYYLLRNLNGCVKMPQPLTHPGRYFKKCSSIVEIQQSLSPLIDDEGALRVTREAIRGLVESVIKNSTDKMALRGW